MSQSLPIFRFSAAGLEYKGPREGSIAHFGWDGIVPVVVKKATPKLGRNDQGQFELDLEVADVPAKFVGADGKEVDTTTDRNGNAINGTLLRYWATYFGKDQSGKDLSWQFLDALTSTGVMSAEQIQQQAQAEAANPAATGPTVEQLAQALVGRRGYAKLRTTRLDSGALATQANGFVTAAGYAKAVEQKRWLRPEEVQDLTGRKGAGPAVGAPVFGGPSAIPPPPSAVPQVAGNGLPTLGALPGLPGLGGLR